MVFFPRKKYKTGRGIFQRKEGEGGKNSYLTRSYITLHYIDILTPLISPHFSNYSLRYHLLPGI